MPSVMGAGAIKIARLRARRVGDSDVGVVLGVNQSPGPVVGGVAKPVQAKSRFHTHQSSSFLV